ncbi:MAG: argininosuccinate synthase [Proteobacteria bacterium]|nr:MAG: argininosuccinate synthase [Pseudomonadota bacterium]
MGTVILAYSGGLDTSFCIPWLREKGHEVITLFVDTGGVSAETRAGIESRATELGAKEHVTVDGSQGVWDHVVVPLVMGGHFYQDQYPLLVSDRYVIVESAVRLAKERGTNLIAHGCTGMGNDQVRFDLAVRALGNFEILAPVRDIQDDHPRVREFERDYLEKRGVSIPKKQTIYTINENLLGVTMSGSEIDEWKEPGPETYQLSAPRSHWPSEPLRTTIAYEQGVAVRLDGQALRGPELLATLNARFGAYGVGRGIYTGDTTVGLKGRIVFEAPGLFALMASHRALEETILTQSQNGMKPEVARKWVELVYKGFFFEPLKDDLEAYLRSSQRFVTGEVTLETHGGSLLATSVQSPHILTSKDATYAQVAGWTAREAEGFIRLLGQSSALSAKVNPRQ